MRVLVVLLLLTSVARAHPLDLGYLRIDGDNVELDADESIKLDAVGTPAGCTAVARHLEAIDRRHHLRQTLSCSPGAHEWSLPFKVMVQQGERLELVEDGRVTIDTTGGVRVFDFVRSGMAHIGVAPSEWRDGLPEGLDHILFVVALMLGGGRVLRLFGIATGFTIGHSITLAIAALGIITPPSSLIEPLVALTIAAAAFEAYSGRLEAHRFKIAVAFGLIHGFAFASALEGVSSGKLAALAGFNVGVELGQLVIIAVCAPVVIRLPRSIQRAIAVMIVACSVVWFFQRV